LAEPAPRGAEATLGATASPLGQNPATADYLRKPGCRPLKQTRINFGDFKVKCPHKAASKPSFFVPL